MLEYNNEPTLNEKLILERYGGDMVAIWTAAVQHDNSYHSS